MSSWSLAAWAESRGLPAWTSAIPLADDISTDSTTVGDAGRVVSHHSFLAREYSGTRNVPKETSLLSSETTLRGSSGAGQAHPGPPPGADPGATARPGSAAPPSLGAGMVRGENPRRRLVSAHETPAPIFPRVIR